MSDHEGAPILVVIVGPIAAGKTTIATGLGRALRARGRSAAVLDLDDVVESVGGFRDLTPRRFEHAQDVLGEVVGSWLARGFDVVAHGPFFHRREDEALLHRVPDGIEARRVLLRCDRETAIRRVAGDPTRGLSREVDVLRRAHDRFERLLPDMPAAELIFDTTTIASDEVVAVLCEALRS